MRNLMCVVVAGALLALTACSDKKGGTGPSGGGTNPQAGGGDKPQDLIVGVWEVEGSEGKGTQEFKKDNTIVMNMEAAGMKITMNGKYKFIEDKVVEVELDPPAGSPEGTPKIKQKLKIAKLTNDELVTKDEKDKEDKFKKKK